MNFFKAYVPTKEKKCLLPFKGKSVDELKTLAEVQDLDEYAGILSDDAILIDVDDEEQSDILLQIVDDLDVRCRVYRTTRGKHFLFLNVGSDGQYICPTNKIKCTLACGISADIKIGAKNSYSVLKYAGKEREIIYDILPDEEYQEVPKWLLPVKTAYHFREMEAGDGRNQALFNYILTLQAAEFTVDECRECLRIINKYVLRDPLSAEELEQIMRDDAFQKPSFFGKRGQFLFDKFAEYLMHQHHIVKINGQMHIYADGIYWDGMTKIEHEMIRHIPSLNRAKRAEVFSYLDVLIEGNTGASDAKYIAFRDCVYDIEADEVKEFAPDLVVTNQIRFRYNEDAYDAVTDRTLDKMACGDPEIRALLEEVAGYVMYRRNELRKAFILIGDKANGKSTYLDMIKTMLGDANTAALDLKELGDRFKTAELFGKLANIGDDIGDEFIPNPAVFKKLTSGERVNAERKGQDPFDFNSYAKLLFSANNIPRIKDKSGAVIDRLIIIPFNATFSPDDPDYDPYIKYKLRRPEAMEYLIQIGLDGLKRVLDRQRFTVSAKVQKELEEYEENNNPILLYLKDEPRIENEPTDSVYKDYAGFCIRNGFTAMSKIEFGKQIKKRLGLESKVVKVGKKAVRVYGR